MLLQQSCIANNASIDYKNQKDLIEQQFFTFPSKEIILAIIPEYKPSDVQLLMLNLHQKLNQTVYSLPQNPVLKLNNFQAKLIFSPCFQARSTSVRIALQKNEWGSGVIFHKVENNKNSKNSKKGNVYYVLTNEHIIKGSQNNINIITNDLSSHKGVVDTRFDFAQDDLAIVEFSSNDNYPIATIINSDQSVGTNEDYPVFATGFPSTQGKPPQFQCLTGNVGLVMDDERVFYRGYQIGYDSNVVHGMSGGGVFDQWGNLVALNGRPLKIVFGNPYVFKRSKKIPCRQISNLALKLSWGIPIRTPLQKIEPILGNITLPINQDIKKLSNSYKKDQSNYKYKEEAQRIKDLKNCNISLID